MVKLFVNNMQIELTQGDITRLETDAITNAANTALMLGAGVAGAIYRNGGQSIQDECNEIGHCDVGKAVITGAGNLKAKHVIHAVGPRMGEGGEDAKLASAIRSTLELAEEKELESVALPAISTGVFGFPVKRCADIMAQQIIDFSFQSRGYLHEVVVCLFDATIYQIFHTTFMKALAKLDDDHKDITLMLDE